MAGVRAAISMANNPKDKNGRTVMVGSRVRIVSLSGDWFVNLPEDEVLDVQSMIGDVFEIEEIDEYGSPWVRKSWPNEKEASCKSHSIALAQDEMELVDAPVP